MALSILKPVLSPLLNPSTTNAAPESAVARRAAEAQAAAQQAAAQQAETQPGVQQSEGVVFDLSDKALQQVEEADAARSAASASAAPVAAAQMPVIAAQTPAAVVSSGAARAASGASLNVKSAEEKAAPVVSERLAPGDPSEEARARAWAIRGMERAKLLDLVEQLKVTPQADPAEKEVAEQTAAQPFVQAAPDRKGAA